MYCLAHLAVFLVSEFQGALVCGEECFQVAFARQDFAIFKEANAADCEGDCALDVVEV